MFSPSKTLVSTLRASYSPIQEMVVIDICALAGSESFSAAKKVSHPPFYIPSSTYSWLAREKAISVRNTVISSSFVGALIRKCEVVAVYLPEILDEVSRKLMFCVDREVPLTDWRQLMLAGHLGCPLLTLDPAFKDQLVKSRGKPLWSIEIQPCSFLIREIQLVYRQLVKEIGEMVYRSLSEGTVEGDMEQFKEERGENIRALERSLRSVGNGGIESLRVDFLCIDMHEIMEEFLNYRLYPKAVIRELCKKTLSCLVTLPVH